MSAPSEESKGLQPGDGDGNDKDGDGKSEQEDTKESDDKTKDSDVGATNPDGAGGKGGVKPGLTAITDKTYELAKQKLLDTETKFTYVNLPEPNLAVPFKARLA